MSIRNEIEDKLYRRIHESHAMARGTVVVDENLNNLVPELSLRNIRVLTPKSGTPDPSIISALLSNRIFITNNSKDFLQSAAEHDTGIIATESLSNKEPKALAALISSIISKYSLWSKRNAYVLYLKDDGRHEYRDLLD